MNLKPTPRFAAIGLALAAYTCWVFADTCLKIAGASALPVYEVIALVGLATMVLLLVYALWRKNLGTLWPKDPLHQLLRSSLDVANNIGVFIALRHLPLVLFYILIFVSPIVTTLLAALLLGETLEWKKSLAILTGFLGVVVAVDPFGGIRPGSWIGYVACLACVGAFSLNIVLSRVLTRTESPESLTFFSGVLRVVVGAAAMIHRAVPVTIGFTSVLGISGMFVVLGSFCFFAALRYASAATVSQFQYSQLVTGALIAYVLWHERLTHTMLAGAALIIVSGLYTAAISSRDNENVRPVIEIG